MKNILVICTGNICRSPLIASILEHEIIKSGLSGSFRVSSAGTFAEVDEPANEYSIEAARSLGIDLRAHRARQFTQKIADKSDLILCATEEHKNYILQNFSDTNGKCLTISECISENFDIADPYGEPAESYQKIADFFTNIVSNVVNFIRQIFTIISIGCDHNGYQLAEQIIQDFRNCKIIAHLPNGPEERVDYPDYAWAVAEDVANKRANFGMLICKSGIGMSIAANKHIKIRAALCNTVELARLTRMHNNANILCLGSMSVSSEIAKEMITAFLTTEFEYGRHEERVKKISKFEKNQYVQR